MQERIIEQAIVKAAKARGGLALKFTSPGFAGMPDRLLLLPKGHIGFVEVKAPGKKPRALQLARHRQLRNLGFQVFVLDNKEQIDEILIQIGGDAR
ncbi:VRR-NUC domain-containing protein [Atopobium minutum]|uniref:VRR-NUC domain-containing protein n=1 Tax=Atopobium minutum TaxID=1381 RepID=A0AB38A486_9ACTN|nr:VRR-NUC domain-containing protein [Atopobium minutum]SEB38652.1 VRR-NUC domain-containing protein [Atopobium minutum]